MGLTRASEPQHGPEVRSQGSEPRRSELHSIRMNGSGFSSMGPAIVAYWTAGVVGCWKGDFWLGLTSGMAGTKQTGGTDRFLS
jgi:hypothetical protein